MERRRYLSVLGSTVAGVGLAAGCIGEGGAPAAGGSTAPGSDTPTQTDDTPDSTTTDGTPTETPPPIDVETPAPGECEAPERPYPETYEGLPDPREYPDPPSAFDVETLRSYLEAYEGAYRYNARLADLAEDDACVEYFETEVTGSTLWDTDDGVVAEVLTTGSFTGETCPPATDTGTGTDTETGTPLPHGDYFTQPAHFLVTERFLVREGTVVECWE
jgi:hypothetical protein